MRIAYLIMVHGHPEQVVRLIEALPSNSDIYIHVDAKLGETEFLSMRAKVLSVRNVIFVKRHSCYWGDIGLVKAEISLIEAALQHPEPFQYASLLSGSDYPIKSNSEIVNYLENHPNIELIESFPLYLPNKWESLKGKLKSPGRFDGYHIRYGKKAIKLPLNRRVPYGLKPFGGSQWWTLSHEALSFIINFKNEHPKYLKFMEHTYIPDEMFFQTILCNSHFRSKLAETNERLIVWDRPEPPYPAVLTASDEQLIRSTSAHFARKFRADDDEIYKIVDRILAEGQKTLRPHA